MHPIIRRVPSRNLPTAAPSVPIRVNRNNQHAHADSRAVGNSHRNEASNAPTNGTFPATEPPHLLVEQVARLSTNGIPTRRSRLAKELAPTFAMDTRKNAVTCPFSLVEQQPSLSFFFLVTTLVGALGDSSQNTQEETLTAADAAPTPTTLTVTFAGDCTLGTDVNFSSDTSFNTKYEAVDDPSYFLANVAGIFKNDDLTVVNMEGTLTTSSTRQDKTFAFKGPADYAQILVKGNVETASLANNHSRDYGEQSYTDTISALENAGIGTFGYDRIDYREVNGVKVALIGTYELAKHLDIQDELKQNIKTAKENGAQLVAVYFHWGTEKETVPDETQIQLGHIAVDEGADLVIGSHPHVIQGYEKYNGRYIVYSLGNFCFGGNPNPSDKDCMIFQQTFTVTGNDVATDDNINVIPCSISSVSNSNNYQPTPATGDEKTRIEAKIKKSSDSIATLSNKVSQSS